jgi:hypothetical protein
MVSLLFRHRPRSGDEVEARLATRAYLPRHARRTVRGVVQGDVLLYETTVTGRPAALPLKSLARVGYTLEIVRRPREAKPWGWVYGQGAVMSALPSSEGAQ